MIFADIYITPVQADRKAAYLEFSKKVAAVYREHGALRVVDCWQAEDEGDQADFHAAGAREEYATGAPLPDFRRAAGARPGETVVVSWVEWPSREARDKGLAAATADPRIQPRPGEEAIFDGRRLIAGGFSMELDG